MTAKRFVLVAVFLVISTGPVVVGINVLGGPESQPIGASQAVAKQPRKPDRAAYRWDQITDYASFPWRDGAGGLVFRDRMWLLGGWQGKRSDYYPRRTGNDVWSSDDGEHWILARGNTFFSPNPAPDFWEGRHTAGYVVFDARMWIIGGDALQGYQQCDVWNSTEGVTWDLVSAEVPWCPRSLFQTFVFQDYIWVLGGQTMPDLTGGDARFYNDVWRTRDGVTWEQVVAEAPWSARGAVAGTVILNDRIWLLGGFTYRGSRQDGDATNDVWSSPDGVNWTPHGQAPWAPRSYQNTIAFDGMMWVIGGSSDGRNRNDVWYSSDGEHWTQLPDTPWPPRHAATLYVYQDALWVVAGNLRTPDVWRLTKTR